MDRNNDGTGNETPRNSEGGNDSLRNAEGIFVDESYLRNHQRQLEIKNQRKIFQNQAFKFFEYSKTIGLLILALGVFIFLILWGLSLFNSKGIQFGASDVLLEAGRISRRIHLLIRNQVRKTQ